MEAKGENVEERVEVAKRYSRAFPQGKPMPRRPLQCDKVGVRKALKLGHASRRLQGSRGHRGSVPGKAGQWRACGWAVVQLDYDEDMGPLHEMYGSVEAEFEVQRTIKRAELTALCLLNKVIGPIRVPCRQQGNY